MTHAHVVVGKNSKNAVGVDKNNDSGFYWCMAYL